MPFALKTSYDEIINAMGVYGGGFVKQLAALYRVSDANNKATLVEAFMKYFIQYDQIALTTRERDATKEKL